VDEWRADVLAAIPVMPVPARADSRVARVAAVRSALVQGATLGVAAGVLWWLGHNTLATLQEHDIPLGFDFLRQPANFDIGDTAWLRFGSQDSIGRAILVGLANTVRVAVLGCLLSVLLGFVLGTLRLASTPAVRGAARAFVEVMRNTPLLLLLLFLDATVRQLPSPGQALHPVRDVFISNRGLALPSITLAPAALAGLVLVVVAWLLARRVPRMRARGTLTALSAAAAIGVVISLLLAHPVVGVPRLTGFNYAGGWTLSPEFVALLGALVLHHAAHISEVVRGALLAVPRQQQDAARALGLTSLQVLRFVTVPQALRAMVPLLVTSCVSLVKNSSLAVAIGFPDLVSVLNTTGNQTGRNIETMLIMVAVYLSISLVVAGALGRYNARLVTRAA
jgi:general L-amino acid transport system permease protein